MGRRPIPHDQNENRRELLAAAARVFAQQPVVSTSVAQLLVEANVSRRTFYKFFPNVEALLEALYASASRVLLEQIRAGLHRGRTPAQKCEGLVDAYLAADTRDGALMRVLAAEALRAESKLAPRRLELFDGITSAVMRELKLDADPRLIQGCLFGLEGLLRRASPMSPRERKKLRAAMLQLLSVLTRGHK